MLNFKRLAAVVLSAAMVLSAGCSDKSGNASVAADAPKTVVTEAPAAAPTAVPTAEPTPIPTPEPTPVPTPEPTPEPVVDEETARYNAMIERSAIYNGDASGLKSKIEKARNGEDVTIAYIGGSITEGYNASKFDKCWASLSYQFFADNYGTGGNVHYVNAGMAGTPSSLGVMRYRREVLEIAPSPPDIVVIEFAVNDNNEATKSRAYEGLAREILKADNAPVVILMFSVFRNGLWNMQKTYMPIAEAYDLAAISIKDAIEPEIKGETMANEDFFAADGYHPVNYGHQIMADCLINRFKYADSSVGGGARTEKNAPAYGDDYEGLLVIDSLSVNDYEGVTVEVGSFGGHDSATGTFKKDNSPKLPNNFKHEKGAGNEPLRITLTCKNFLLSYKLSKKDGWGHADIFVDGMKAKTVNAFSSGAWDNPETIQLFNFADLGEAAEHVVEIKMAEGDEDAQFTVMIMGFTQ